MLSPKLDVQTTLSYVHALARVTPLGMWRRCSNEQLQAYVVNSTSAPTFLTNVRTWLDPLPPPPPLSLILLSIFIHLLCGKSPILLVDTLVLSYLVGLSTRGTREERAHTA